MGFKNTKRPSIKEGNSGDIKVVKESGKTNLYAKVNNIWDRIGIDVIGNPPNGSVAFFQDNNTLQFNQSLMYKLGVFKFTKSIDVTGDIKVTSANRIGVEVESSFTGPSGVRVKRTGGDSVSLLANYSGFGGGLSSTDALRFTVNDADADSISSPAMYIETNNRVGIGTTTPNVNLQVDGSDNTQIQIRSSDGTKVPILALNNTDMNWHLRCDGGNGDKFIIRDNTNSANRLVIDTTGKVGIGTTSPSVKLDVNGTVKATGFTIGGHTIDDIDIGSEFVDADDHLMSSGAIKEKIEAYGYSTTTGDITGVTLTADDSNVASDTSGSADFTIAGGEGVDTSVSGTTITIAGEDASTSNKGVASFSSDNFAVSSGAVTIKSGGVDLTDEVTGVLPSANMDSDTAHLSGAQTFTGAKTFDDNIFIKESASADADVAGDGQLWVKNDSPNNLYFTNDAGNDVQITDGTSLKQTTFTHIITHNFDCAGSGAVYIPFGGSQIESAFVSDVVSDDTRFIAPFDGKLIKLMFQSASAPNQTDALLRVNGTDGAGAASFTAGHGNAANTTVICVINDSANSFNAGDRLRVKIDPTDAPDETAMTSIWEFTL